MKVILYMAMTANGYIAKENDETPWSEAVWNGYYEFIKKRGNIILGKRTYELMKEVNEFEKLGFPVTVVVSSSARSGDDERTTFVSLPEEAVAVMKEKGIEEAVVGGGSTLNAGFLKDGLLDEVCLDVDPLFFGKGIKLFAETDAEAKLRLLEVSKLSESTVRLRYEVLKSSGYQK